jgi:hypothetical protein
MTPDDFEGSTKSPVTPLEANAYSPMNFILVSAEKRRENPPPADSNADAPIYSTDDGITRLPVRIFSLKHSSPIVRSSLFA